MDWTAVRADTLVTTLRPHRRRLRRRAAADATVAALAGLVGAATVAVAVDAVVGMSSTGRIATDATVIVAAAIVAVVVVSRNLRLAADPLHLARRIDRGSGETDAVANAVDLAASGTTASPSLVALAVDRARRTAASLDPATVVDRRPLRTSLGALAFLTTLATLAVALWPGVVRAVVPRLLVPTGDHPPYTRLTFAVSVDPQPPLHGRAATIRADLTGPTLPRRATAVFLGGGSPDRIPMVETARGRFRLRLERLARDGGFYIDTPHGRSRRHALDAVALPAVERVRLRYDYPAYTGRSPTIERLGSGGIEALEGTEVTVEAKSNLPLARGTLKLETEERTRTVRLRSVEGEPRRVRGSFRLRASGSYTLRLRSRASARSRRRRGPLTSRPDRPPDVRLLRPRSEVTAPARTAVPLSIRADDDVGVGRLWLRVRLRRRGRATRLSVPIARPGSATAARTTELRPSSVGARPGDVLVCRAMATDVHPTAQRGRSRRVTIRVVGPSPSERTRLLTTLEALADEKETLRDRAASLADRIAEGGSPTGGQERRAAKVQAAKEAYREGLKRAARRAGAAASGTKPLRRAAASLRSELRSIPRGGSAAAKESVARLRRLAKALDGSRGLQRAIAALRSGGATRSSAGDPATSGAAARADDTAWASGRLLRRTLSALEAASSRSERGASPPEGKGAPDRPAAGEDGGRTAAPPAVAPRGLDLLPGRYRSLAEAYFRRLASDAERPAPPSPDDRQ